MQVWYIRALGAIAGFAVWTVFSIPLFTGRPGIREAWDFPSYWSKAIPLLLLLVVTAGYAGRDIPWKLALSVLDGHFLGVALVKQPMTDFGLLPLSLVLLGVPGRRFHVGGIAGPTAEAAVETWRLIISDRFASTFSAPDKPAPAREPLSALPVIGAD